MSIGYGCEGMCDAAWCAPCTLYLSASAGLSLYLGRYNKIVHLFSFLYYTVSGCRAGVQLFILATQTKNQKNSQ